MIFPMLVIPVVMFLVLFAFAGIMIWYQLRSIKLLSKLTALSVYIDEARTTGRTSDAVNARQKGVELLAKADPLFRAVYGRAFIGKFSDNLSDVLK